MSFPHLPPLGEVEEGPDEVTGVAAGVHLLTVGGVVPAIDCGLELQWPWLPGVLLHEPLLEGLEYLGEDHDVVVHLAPQ